MSIPEEQVTLEFADPVVTAPTREQQRQWAEALKKHPGRWAKYPWPGVSYGATRALASRISCGKISAFGRGFTAMQRKGEVFVKYIGTGR